MAGAPLLVVNVREDNMTATEAKVGSVIRTTVDCPPAPAGTVGKIIGHYFIGYHIHAISVRWELPDQPEVEPAIIPRDHLGQLEVLTSRV
jgi:hypothetical protein